MKFTRLALPVVLLLAAGCGKEQTPSAAAPAASGTAAASASAIKAPAGTYKLDPNHASLTFKINHIGLANYVARFTKFDAAVNLDPVKLENSSVTATVAPLSVRTDYAGDFKATHQDSPYQTWEERLGRDPKFFNADQFAEITFKSTKVEADGKGSMRVTGDLTFLGQTRPITLHTTIVGSMDKHPFTGRGAIGFSATTEFNRSEWGMTGTQPHLGDLVTVTFDGEFMQAAPDEPAPASAN